MCDRTFPRVQVFGPLRVYDEHSNEHVPTRKAVRTLLLFLALNGKCVHVEQAMDVLWPNLTVPEARHRLNGVLERLPAPIAPLIAREGQTIVLEGHTDIEDHERALMVISRHRSQQLAPDAIYEPWAEPARRWYSASLEIRGLQASARFSASKRSSVE